VFIQYECISWNIALTVEKLQKVENNLAHSYFGPLIAQIV